jgi:hypothetical protein
MRRSLVGEIYHRDIASSIIKMDEDWQAEFGSPAGRLPNSLSPGDYPHLLCPPIPGQKVKS